MFLQWARWVFFFWGGVYSKWIKKNKNPFHQLRLCNHDQLYLLKGEVHPCPVVKRTAGSCTLSFRVSTPTSAWHNLSLNTPGTRRAVSTVPGHFPTERRRATAFVAPGTRVVLIDGKHSPDPGQWSAGQRELPVCLCTSAHRCCQHSRQHADSSAGLFYSQVTSPHMNKRDRVP